MNMVMILRSMMKIYSKQRWKMITTLAQINLILILSPLSNPTTPNLKNKAKLANKAQSRNKAK